MSVVEIKHVSRRRGGRVVLRHVDLLIGDGEFLVLVGPSGCGKTTLLRMVAGLDPVSNGQILVDGVPIRDVHRGQRKVAMMFQEPALYPHMTVCENLGYPLRMAGERRQLIARRVVEMAEVLEITHLLQHRPRTLSGGQRQRVAMGRALIRQPDLLLMDEPMSNVDAQLRGGLRAMISRLHHRFGITTLYVTHDQVEAMSLADRIAVMRSGEIVQVGTPAEIYHRPIDTFVATFVGSPAMNLFAATVRHSTDGPHLVTPAGTIEIGRRFAPSPVDRDVVVGVRPQAVRFADHGLHVDVEQVETAAGRCTVTALLAARSVDTTGGVPIVSPPPARLTIDVPVDQEVALEMWRPSSVTFDSDDIHLFDVETGRALGRGGLWRPDGQVSAATSAVGSGPLRRR